MYAFSDSPRWFPEVQKKIPGDSDWTVWLGVGRGHHTPYSRPRSTYRTPKSRRSTQLPQPSGWELLRAEKKSP